MVVQEPGDPGWQPVHPHDPGGNDRDGPGFQPAKRVGELFYSARVIQDGSGGGGNPPPSVGEPEAPAVPVEQRDVEAGLEQAELLADGTLGEINRLGRSASVLEPREGDERVQLVEGDARSVCAGGLANH